MKSFLTLAPFPKSEGKLFSLAGRLSVGRVKGDYDE